MLCSWHIYLGYSCSPSTHHLATMRQMHFWSMLQWSLKTSQVSVHRICSFLETPVMTPCICTTATSPSKTGALKPLGNAITWNAENLPVKACVLASHFKGMLRNFQQNSNKNNLDTFSHHGPAKSICDPVCAKLWDYCIPYLFNLTSSDHI